jgi:hypothetical protein
MYAFMLVSVRDTEIEGVSHDLSNVAILNDVDMRSRGAEVQRFAGTARLGDVLQLQEDKYIVALGLLTVTTRL